MPHSLRSNRSAIAAIGLAFVLVTGLLASPAAAQQASDAARSRALVLGTGGTIAGQASARAGNAYDSANRNVEVNDDELGFAVSLDLNPQKARVLLELLIANGITEPKAVQQAFVATQ
ncbi:hypothetical protein MTX26_04460 [Bradyrhizobium sp. ISRA443]|uniref:hypothetical protein n=1 Tax=unclassified Bradyrhizobium TaxID=2631580 RepID=UPI00247889FB|nr:MULTISPECIES: hypothetical protein [unclassified Bradyrhizobium]WGR95194.1 hypothetical protein MTX20_14600 [Bradyrhizobium sp. ISRA435]WGS00116.1 hypothetical protein MTX23_04460 [Bradyrhizobium sp. ISRA436]WGS07005.1 hypothetical protein MTX18_04460 [Bradyrhizobium sp. ISRA437]WGS13887.1 hypothetical protein MTX26_04460 [Bradyrhizobium sp. ISRA443]